MVYIFQDWLALCSLCKILWLSSFGSSMGWTTYAWCCYLPPYLVEVSTIRNIKPYKPYKCLSERWWISSTLSLSLCWCIYSWKTSGTMYFGCVKITCVWSDFMTHSDILHLPGWSVQSVSWISLSCWWGLIHWPFILLDLNPQILGYYSKWHFVVPKVSYVFSTSRIPLRLSQHI